MIQLVNVKKVYDNGVVALNNININIKRGEFVFLIGSTGSGKSTLIKLLYREEVATSGKVQLGNLNLNTIKHRRVPFLRQKLGVVFQDFKLLSQRTVFENVAFALKVMGVDKEEQLKRTQAALDLTGLSELTDEYVTELSGGERQRVAIARAIVNTPSLLLADEPTGNLDPENSREIMSLLSKINQRGTTVIVSTHNKLIVDAMRKRVITLERGHLIQDQEQGGYSVELD